MLLGINDLLQNSKTIRHIPEGEDFITCGSCQSKFALSEFATFVSVGFKKNYNLNFWLRVEIMDTEKSLVE